MERKVKGRGGRPGSGRGFGLAGRFLAVALLLAAAPLPVGAQQEELAVRAAYIYHLTEYVTWPRHGNDLLIGVVGSDSMEAALKSVIEGKESGGRKIHVLTHSSEAELKHCDLVYLADAALSRGPALLDHLQASGVLTVGESDRFVRVGGMVGLIRSGDQIQLEVNLDAVNVAGLRISSRLLELAVIAHPGKRG
jgi:hypothetical protein